MLLSLQPAVIFSLILFVLVDLYLFYSFIVVLLGFQKGEGIKALVQPTLFHHKVFESGKELGWKMDGRHCPGQPIFYKSPDYTSLGTNHIQKS